MISTENQRKNQTDSSKSKVSEAPADWVQMMGAAKTKQTTVSTSIAMKTNDSRFDA